MWLGFRGAYFSGSTIWLPADAESPPASDVDIVVVTAQDEPGLKLGKFRYLGALLEVTYLSWNQYAGNSHSIAARHFSTYLSLPVSMP
jgi:hypothetical protein